MSLGCGGSNFESLARKEFEKRIEEGRGSQGMFGGEAGKVKLVSFKELKREKAEIAGQSIVALDCEAELELLESGYWDPNMPYVLFKDAGPFGRQQVNKGDRVKTQKSFEFHKGDGGWNVSA